MTTPDSLRILWRFFRFRPRLVWAYLATDVLVNYSMFLIPGLLVRAALNALSESGQGGGGPWPALGLLALAQAVGFLAGGLGGWYSHQHAEQTYSTLVRANLLGRLLRRPAAEALPVSAAEALSRLDRDVSQLGSRVVVWETLAEGIVVLLAVLLLGFLAGWVATLVAVPLAVVAVATGWLSWRLGEARQTLQRSSARITGLLAGAFAALPVVRAAGAERAVGARFEELAEARRAATLRDTFLTQLLHGLAGQTDGIAVAVVLFLLGAHIAGGRLSVGDLALVVTYASTVSNLGTWLGGDLAAWSQTSVSLRRLRELAPEAPAVALAAPRPVLRGEPPTVRSPKPAGDLRSLQVRNLGCVLDGRHVLSGVGLEVGAGEAVVVAGRLGAGKSTLLRAILGMQTAAGEISWNGEPVGEPAAFLVPPRCAYLPQTPVLLSGSLRENLELGVVATDEEVTAAIRMAALDADLVTFPEGLETRIGRRGLRLSGGQLQRMALARVLLRRPALAVLDDLSSAVDRETEQAILQRLGALGCARLIVSNRRPVLAAADRVLLLQGGRVTATGPADSLLETSDEFRALWRTDAR